MRFLLKFLVLILITSLFCSCRISKLNKTYSLIPDKISESDKKYALYREQFFKYFLDESRNRYHGCVPEKIYINAEYWGQENYLENFIKIKFADSTIYTAMALAFLANDILIQQNKNNEIEINRSLQLFKQVLQGLYHKDKASYNDLDGFYLRDTVGQIDGLEVESDFLNTVGGSNEMSGSQSNAIMYGLHFALLTFKHLEESSVLETEPYQKEMHQQMQRLVQYLQANKFVIRSEIKPNAKVRRGPYVFPLRWIYQEINGYWNLSEKNNARECLWTLFYKGIDWFCRLNVLSIKKYQKYSDESPKTFSGKSYMVLYSHLLETALLNIRTRPKDLRRWRNSVWRYQNTLAVCLALQNQIEVPVHLQNMAIRDLTSAPNHLPNDFSKDHKGWNQDNRWIRLMHRKEVPQSKEIIQVYNGLDFLWAYSAWRLWYDQNSQ